MKKEELHAIAQEAAKNIKTEHDLTELTKCSRKLRLRQLSMLNWMST